MLATPLTLVISKFGNYKIIKLTNYYLKTYLVYKVGTRISHHIIFPRLMWFPLGENRNCFIELTKRLPDCNLVLAKNTYYD